MRQTETEMREQIFSATEKLMAKDGLHHLSMQKIAKAANISAGTIYLYFKNKEELLERLAENVLERFQQDLKRDYQPDLPFFAQYRQMWKNIWLSLLAEPDLVLNIYQYQSLPAFCQVLKQSSSDHWQDFCQRGKQAGVLCDLPQEVLFVLSLETAVKLAFKRAHFGEEFSESTIEAVIERSWQSILK